MKHSASQTYPPRFDGDFCDRFQDLLIWRRDVRSFRPDPVPQALLDRLLDLIQLAPSVGNSQPWRFVSVESMKARAFVRASFEQCNREALAGFTGERAQTYAGLKLSGLDQAPVQLAVFCDEATEQGDGLGRRTMSETSTWSVVGAVHLLWLAARSRGLGLGWISILDPARVTEALEVPPAWRLIAYLCLGWPQEEHDIPELERLGWQQRTTQGRTVLRR
ncbi:5,6-dimethylbenzimidazole synthase [Microvirga brassicacearum]|uniref:5,6-dimethylbenzimidazole synthase n=1 Tax=Microvirga brassicacearum TaxID=2580413 RepID=A0A5N3P4V5_9HYPH|nr:5,6-dimethylbenzimidazole synthase [Microvirga brassicacearum]KAB0264770.1 5,6-dimethylbenzimidazole synthase [Microvirga brassicacearum]